MRRELFGEFLATFILIIFGCGSVGAAVVMGWLTELWQVALLWGCGVSIGIFASRRFSPSHMSPAISLAMVVSNEMPLRKLFPYAMSQLLGAFSAAFVVYLFYADGIIAYELENGMVRGSTESAKIAMMFGEYFPNPGYADRLTVGHLSAFVIEVVATFVLLTGVYLFSKKPHKTLTPIGIGVFVAMLIIIVAPYTQACFNPARDFGPRLLAYFAGWGRAAFPPILMSAFTVYVFAPLLGASLAALVFRKPS